MAKIKILSVKELKLDTGGFTHAKPPATGFTIVLNLDSTLETAVKDTAIRKVLGAVAENAYKKYRLQTARRLQRFDKIFAGMIAKGATPAAVAKQAEMLKTEMEKETPKWERAAAREALDTLKKLTKKKR